MILYDTQHWWTKNCHKWMGQWLLWRLDVFKDILRVSWWFMHHHYSQDRILIVLRNHVVSLIFLVPAVAVMKQTFKILFFLNLLFLYYYLFAQVSVLFLTFFSKYRNGVRLLWNSQKFIILIFAFFLMFLAYDVDVLLFKKIPNA